MERLTQKDLCALMDCLRELYSPLDLQTFPTWVLSVLPKVVPAEVMAYGAFNLPGQQPVAVVEPADVGFPKDDPTVAQELTRHPLIDRYQRTQDGRAYKISDLLTRQQFYRLALYHNFHRRVGIEDQMMIHFPLSPPRLVGISFSRNRRNFSERDRMVLNLFLPHLTQAYHNAGAVTQMRQELDSLKQLVEESDRGVILLTKEGCIRWMTEPARQWVTAYCGALPSPHRLPEELWQWVRSQHSLLAQLGEVPPPRGPRVIEREGGRLIVRLLSDSSNDLHLLLLEERRDLSAASLATRGRGQREAEVLFWVTQGKDNLEVGIILGLSPRTIHKNLERIYRKLDVSTRSMATRRAMELLGLLQGKCYSQPGNIPVFCKNR
ncbi:MAG: helix-turn-helix transcriptional regulator [Candidatus Tectomicrobia bacterium]|uniref:Helix-turn-helix transcriptional regulator n=1 Tax=Tectimicrobiota bacterium TaxID=2528274 RepID=A0A932CN17_UNCTE|nr:helix-turn-helix transcriptional regulator [Candidatus Tectomicrobia bacterium]